MFQSSTAEKIPKIKTEFSSRNYKEVKDSNFESAVGNDVFDFISLFVNIKSDTTKIFETSSEFNIKNLDAEKVENFVNIRRINDTRYLNKHFEAVNEKLPAGGTFILCAELKGQRKKRILNKYPKVISYPYYAVDFIIKRIFPKWKPTKKLYFYLTRGNNRVLSMSEILGRLISCGFKIVHYKDVRNLTYFVAKKETVPTYNPKPSYGIILKIKRVGKEGKFINVYKLRTMHPYSEYLQKFIYTTNHLKEGGKINNDYRVTHWGKIFRRLWIDELPMLYNWIKGELKLVGLRPLSPHYLSLYDEDFVKRRIKYKPGLIPPYYVDLPKSLEEIISSEMKYLDHYEKNPVKTDMKYFFKVSYQIFFKGVRSS